MGQADALQAAVLPLNIRLAMSLTEQLAVPAWAGSVAGLFNVIAMAALVGLLCGLCAALRGAARPAAALLAAAIFLWSARIGGDNIATLFGRWDHLVFCAAAGYALGDLALPWRRAALSAISLYFIVAHVGLLPTGILAAGTLLGLAALRLPGAQRAWPTALLQGGVLLGTFAVISSLRWWNLSAGLLTQGPFAFVLLRHVSFVVETRRGRPAGLSNYLCYLLFYPSFIGASEIYSEFHDRNLTGDGRYDYRAAAYKIIVGQLQLWAALQYSLPFEQVIQIRDPLQLWGNVLALFTLSALYVMGLWSMIEGLARLYGVQLRPNFDGVLTCLNPAQFWRSWRATMTNWLIHYVYIPLGGNRQHLERNIAAAFAVSVLWHWMGIPFYTLDLSPLDFAPMALWGVINAAGVASYVRWRRRGRTILPAATPQPLRVGSKIALTWVFATFTVTLLTFTPQTTQYFVPFLRTLAGFPP
jgi:D-alanyl-lipoteichoic acid acyltransferase DltB (MBOAT superfamily)